MIPERMGCRVCRHQLWHEAQLDKWANAIGKQAVIYLIHVAEVPGNSPGLVLVVYANLIMEDSMESDVFESRDVLDGAEITAVIVA